MHTKHLKKHLMSFYLIFAFITAGFIGFLLVEDVVDEISVEAKTYIVDINGNGNYTTIQAAIDAASSGDTIRVWAGEYKEKVTIGKTLSLVGNGTGLSIINGSSTWEAININANWVNITGFTITSSDLVNGMGISSNGGHLHIYSNNFTGNRKGSIETFATTTTGDHVVIENNSFNESNAFYVITFAGDHSLISNNTITNIGYGIKNQGSDHSTIKNNTITCGGDGIWLNYAKVTIVEDNNITSGKRGIYFWDSNWSKISNNTLHDSGVYFEGDEEQFWNTNNITSNNYLDGKPVVFLKDLNNSAVPLNAGQIILANCSNITIKDRNMSNSRGGIQIGFSENITVINNTCHGYKSINNLIWPGVRLYECETVKIHNNNLTYNDYGIHIINSYLISVENNTCDYYNGTGIYLRYTYRSSIVNNTCNYGNRTGIMADGIDVDNSNYNLVSNNTCSFGRTGINSGGKICLIINNTCNNNSDYGIKIIRRYSRISNNICNYNNYGIYYVFGTGEDHQFNIVDNNTCNYNKYDGLYLQAIFDSVVSDNNASHNDYNGIAIQSGKYNVICNNIADSNAYDGMGFYSYFSRKYKDNVIKGNSISNNANYGLYMYNVENNVTVYDNIFYNNSGSGVYLDSTTTNIYVFQNCFINNTPQAADLGTNYWNNSNDEGNYWSDYSGLDNGAGGRVAGDGIGDTNIPHLSLDNFPYMKCRGWYKLAGPVLSDPGELDTDGNYTIAWTGCLAAIGYMLEESTDENFTTTVELYNGSGTHFDIIRKDNGTYYYRARARDCCNYTNWSEPVNITVDWAPLPPAGLLIKNITGHNITLEWALNTEPDIAGYHILINDTGAGSGGPYVLLATVSNTTSNYTIYGLHEGITYYFKVVAFDHSRTNSSYAAGYISVTTPDLTAPLAPSNLNATAQSKSSIKLTWEANSESDLAGYLVFMNDTMAGPTGSFHLINTLLGTGTTYTVPGLAEQVTYHFKLKAFDEVPNNSSLSNVATATTLDQTAPAAPAGLGATALDNHRIKLDWTANLETDLTGYLIYMNDTGSLITFHLLQSLVGTQTTYTATGLAEEVTYYFKLRAFDEVPNNSTFSTVASATTLDMTPPAAPVGLTAVALDNHRIKLDWTANIETDLTGYLIYMNDTGSSSAFHLLYSLMGSSTSYTATGLAEEVTYYFKLKAFDEVPNNSSFSAVASATTPDQTPPPAPTGVEATGTSNSEIDLDWDLGYTTDLAGYLIYMNDTGEGAGGSYKLIDTIASTINDYRVTGLTEQVEYHFKLVAFDEVPNNSSFSNVASATTPDVIPPAPPSNLKVKDPTPNSLTVTWDPGPDHDVIGYFLYRGESASGTFDQVNPDPIKTTEFKDTGLNEDSKYFYKLKAVDDADLRSDFSKTVSGVTLIGKRPPMLKTPLLDFSIPEDSYVDNKIALYEVFEDDNDDVLYFKCEGNKNIEVTIYQYNGTVVLKPKHDWNGRENLTFTATDDNVTYASDIVEITVTGVNDPPYNASIYSVQDQYYYRGNPLFTGDCEDPDLVYGDELSYEWYSDIDGKLGEGKELALEPYTLEVGVHEIKVVVTDSGGLSTEAAMEIEIVKMPEVPPGKNDTGEDAGSNKMLIAGSAVAIAVVVVLIVLFLLMRKKKQAPDTRDRAPGPEGSVQGAVGEPVGGVQEAVGGTGPGIMPDLAQYPAAPLYQQYPEQLPPQPEPQYYEQPPEYPEQVQPEIPVDQVQYEHPVVEEPVEQVEDLPEQEPQLESSIDNAPPTADSQQPTDQLVACPTCGSQIAALTTPCPHCNTELKWR